MAEARMSGQRRLAFRWREGEGDIHWQSACGEQVHRGQVPARWEWVLALIRQTKGWA